MIVAEIRCNPANPGAKRPLIIKCVETLVAPQKRILCQVLGLATMPLQAEANAKHRGLVALHQGPVRVVLTLPGSPSEGSGISTG